MKSAINNVPPIMIRPLQLQSLSPATSTPFPSPKREPDVEQQKHTFEQQLTDLNLMRAHIAKLAIENPDFEVKSKLLILGLDQDIGYALSDLQSNLVRFQNKAPTKPEITPPVEVWYLQEIFNRYVNLIAEINAKPRSVLVFFSAKPKRQRVLEHGAYVNTLTPGMLSEAACSAEVASKMQDLSFKM